MADPVYGFPEAAAKRIGSTVKRVEAAYQNAPIRQRLYPAGGGGGGLIPCIITSNVTAGSETSPSLFTAAILQPGTAPALTTAGELIVTAYNRAAGITLTASTLTPKSGWLTEWNATYYLVSADC